MKEPKLYIMTMNKISGIYTITNKVTGKLYIGESLDIYRRWHDEHIPQLRKNSHYNRELQNDFNKNGEENFSFEVLHCKYNWIANNDSYEGKYVDVMEHSLLEQMAKSLIMTKYDLSLDYFKEID